MAEVGPLTFKGLPAWVVWHGAYLMRIGSWRKRTRLLDDWALAELLGRETSQLRLDADQEPRASNRADRPVRLDASATHDSRAAAD